MKLAESVCFLNFTYVLKDSKWPYNGHVGEMDLTMAK